MQEENPRGKFGPIFARVTAISICVSDVFDGERGGGVEKEWELLLLKF